MAKKRITKAFWIWCQFSKIDNYKILKLKRIINNKFHGPRFEIHLTLKGPYKKLDQIDHDSIVKTAQKIKEFNLYLDKLETSNQKYQSIFFSIKKSYNLIQIRKMFSNKKIIGNLKSYKPHISLHYGVEMKKEKEKLISMLPKITKKVKINIISIVDVNEERDKWKIIKKIRLKNL
tara:strand:- start:290 stop:817 length:528 start_codon:yes stop_codon:yes gene_type:complete